MMKVLAHARLEKAQYELKWNTAETSNYTIISFKLLQKQKTLITIYDMAGRLVRILANAELQAGTHKLSWDAKDEEGSAVSAGIYFLRMQVLNYSETRKPAIN
jgi:flagellar hook assembly protein FlgD